VQYTRFERFDGGLAKIDERDSDSRHRLPLRYT
jgi:hypothetical protein